MAIFIYTTTPNKKEAKNIIKILFQKRLVACIHSHKVSSFYTWDRKFCKDKEISLCIKTKGKHFKKIKRLILDNHSYEVPEICKLKVDKMQKKYHKWLVSQC